MKKLIENCISYQVHAKASTSPCSFGSYVPVGKYDNKHYHVRSKINDIKKNPAGPESGIGKGYFLDRLVKKGLS